MCWIGANASNFIIDLRKNLLIKMLNYLLNLSILLILSFSVSKCESKPNFLIILSDDQDDVLGGMKPMHYVKRHIAKEGVVFANSYTVSPVCCPSRSSILTGLYQHNHHTLNNSVHGGCYSRKWREKMEPNTFASILNKGGYETFYAGKYLNQYGNKKTASPKTVPPGWTHWHGLIGNSRYYNYTICSNGVLVYSEENYLTDIIRDLGISFLQSRVSESPFLMFLSPPAPHAPFTPPPRYVNYYANVTALRTPHFNSVPKDKHWLMNLSPIPLPSDTLPYLDFVYRSRWEALLAVDELFYDIYVELQQQQLLNETYIIYTSDNGYHIGQFSQVMDKRQPYETDIKVPLLIRGPGIKEKSFIYDPVLNIDLAPTIIKLAGLEIPETMDGKVINLTKTDDMNSMDDRFILVEYTGEYSEAVSSECPWKYDSSNLAECSVQQLCKCEDSRNNTYACAVGIAFDKHIKYCQFDDSQNFEEMYDLISDPYETDNIVHDIFPAIKNWYRLILDQLRHCTGRNCINPLPKRLVV